MTATLIDGAAIAAAILDEAARDVRALRDEGVRPGLAAVLVGDDPASHVYVRNKIKACARVGVESRVFTLSSSSTHRDVLDLVRSLNRNDSFHGILVQLPLPPHLDPFPIIEALDPAKDVDGLHPTSMGLLAVGRPSFVPATPAGILRMLLHLGVDPDGKTVVICGRSNIVGKPLALLLSQEVKHANATIILCHTHTHDIASLMRRGDIVVIATGDPQWVKADHIRPGAVVIDVGINRVSDASAKRGYRLVGDVDFDEVKEVASMITPVPGGVGPVTVAMLVDNTVRAARLAARTSSAAGLS